MRLASHARFSSLLWVVVSASGLVGALQGCGASGNSEDTAGQPTASGGGASTGGGAQAAGSGGAASPDGLPCDVRGVLESLCWSCHNDPPSGAPISLVSLEQLRSASPIDGKPMAERAVARMLDAKRPMPPKGSKGASAADVAVLQAWVDGGLLAGSCGAGGAGSGAAGATGAGGAAQGGAAGAPMVTGLPCDLAGLLSSRCGSCHGDPPASGVPVRLTTYEDLVAPSVSDSSKSNGQLAYERMTDPTAPMPPKASGPATAAEAAIVKAWLDGGMQHGSCASGGAAGAGGSGGAAGAGAGGAAGGASAADDLPCDIKTIIEKSCISCHNDPPVGAAPMALTSWAALQAASSTPGVTVAQASLARMQGMGKIMPPAPASPVAAADIAAFKAWVDGGAPQGTGCGAPITCSSGQHWTPPCTTFSETACLGDPAMNPGRACISCHKATDDEDKAFWVAGTVYPTLHEEDFCYGADGESGAFSGTKVVVTDAAGVDWPLPVGATGNFYLLQIDAPTFAPGAYGAKIVGPSGAEKVMTTKQSSGDCNSCHTQQGANKAPGRITVP